jgi:hypothetical protein
MAGIQDTNVGIVAFDHESVTIAAASTPLTAATYLDATRAVMTLETAEIRITTDGTAAAAAVGHIIKVDDVVTIVGTAQIARFRGYRTTGVSGVLKVTYFR